MSDLSECTIVSGGVGGTYCIRSSNNFNFPPLARARPFPAPPAPCPDAPVSATLYLLLATFLDGIIIFIYESIIAVLSGVTHLSFALSAPFFPFVSSVGRVALLGGIGTCLVSKAAGSPISLRLFVEGAALGLVVSFILLAYEVAGFGV